MGQNSKTVKLFIDNLKIKNLIYMRKLDPETSKESSNQKVIFLQSNDCQLDYHTDGYFTRLGFCFDATDCQVDIDLISFIYHHLLPVLNDYTIYNKKLTKTLKQHNFYNISFNEEFKLNRWGLKYHFVLNADFKTLNISYDPEVEAYPNRRFVSKSALIFTYEVLNGIMKYKLTTSEFPIYFVSDSEHNQTPVIRNFLKFQNICIIICFTSDYMSNVEVGIENIACHISYKSLQLLLEIKNKYIAESNASNHLSSSKLTLESTEDINQNNVFQPHNLSVYSKRLENDYEASTIHVDQLVYARYKDGLYYEAVVLSKFSSHYIISINQLETEYEISALDRLAVIPSVIVQKRIFKINDYVLVKNHKGQPINYKMGQIIDFRADKVIIRSFTNYHLDVVDPEYISRFPAAILSPYRGIGLNLFCRYYDGVFYPACVLKRKDFCIEFEVFKSNENPSLVVHKIVDDSCFALMWDRCCSGKKITRGDNVLVVMEDVNGYMGKVARFYSEENSKYLVKFFHDGKMVFSRIFGLSVP
ncbi:hypothetical protein RF11_00596 [Thelohanellus kitauei]|uniref:Tudor domain-containing protein n=1 Tax=Thelohanellus kitauei TaxID=669202 RepID=A0A0C2MGM8_THEKT|nr:hypothetical protein RF11_00596 [Thelohanellus kitauei]